MQGYVRINSSLIMATVIVASVLVYQFIVYSGEPQRRPVADGAPRFATLQLFPQTMPVLDKGFYELWVTDEDGLKESLGKFSLNSSQEIIDPFSSRTKDQFFTLPSELGNIVEVVIAISNSASPRSGRSVDFLSGEMKNERSSLSFNEVDLSSSVGQYMLATPTDNDSFVNEKSGLWFGDVVTGQAGLVLPDLPSGWVYEGWAVDHSRTITTGKFTSTTRADRFNGFSFNLAPGPSFPGEDFLQNPPVSVFPDLVYPLDLADQIAQISIEPEIEGVDPTGAAPFVMSFLSANIPKRAAAQKLYDLEFSTEDFPKATAVLR